MFKIMMKIGLGCLWTITKKKYLVLIMSFAPSVKCTTLRVLLAIAATHSISVHQLDVESSFKYSPLQDVVYVRNRKQLIASF